MPPFEKSSLLVKRFTLASGDLCKKVLVCSRQTDTSRSKEQAMTLSKTLHRQVAIAILAVSAIVIGMSSATAQRSGRGELINRMNTAPFACWVDEGYGRASNCDQGGGG